MGKVNVYATDPQVEGIQYQSVIARVNYNERLDTWDGSNWGNGGLGMHKGITKLRKPIDPGKPYVIIIGSQYEGAVNIGYTVDADEAADEIIKAEMENESWVWPEIRSIINELENEAV